MTTNDFNDFHETATRNGLAATTPQTGASPRRRVMRAIATASVAAALLLGVAGTHIGAAAVDATQESANTLAIVYAWPSKYCGCG